MVKRQRKHLQRWSRVFGAITPLFSLPNCMTNVQMIPKLGEHTSVTPRSIVSLLTSPSSSSHDLHTKFDDTGMVWYRIDNQLANLVNICKEWAGRRASIRRPFLHNGGNQDRITGDFSSTSGRREI